MTGRFPLFLALSLAWGGCVPEPPVGSDIAARVAGVEVTWPEVREWMTGLLGESDEALEGTVSSQLFDQYLDELLLERLALDRGLPPEDADDRRRLLAFLVRQGDLRGASELEARAYYEAHRERWRRPERVRVRQILVEDRATAEEARAALAEGRSFAEVAESLSEEPLAHLGGDQGLLGREDLPAAFADIIFDLDPGEISSIVPAEYGFHIFQVIERRPAEEMSFAEVAPEIVRSLDRRRIDAEIERLVAVARESYNVRVYRQNLPFDYEGLHPVDE